MLRSDSEYLGFLASSLRAFSAASTHVSVKRSRPGPKMLGSAGFRHGGVVVCLSGDPASELAFAMVLRIQSGVEQLCKMVQGGSHGGQFSLG